MLNRLWAHFDVHGYSMSTENQNGETQLRQRGMAAGFIVVHPQGSGIFLPSWNAGDDATVFDMVLSMANAFNVDRNRIHFGGFSQGGWMTWRMVCNQALSPRPSDVIASFGPIAAGFGGSAASCYGAGGGPQTSILLTHGRSDAIVSFNEALRAVADISLAQSIDPNASQQTLANTTFFDRVRYTGAGIHLETIFHTEGHYIISDGATSTVYGRTGPIITGQDILEFYQAHPLGSSKTEK
eukprot:TRINITY_DN3030_c0_g1_i1.p1 TRINITY_DN3030_c0_g1~~TRINITY_DN3030_c0_g1_i1.p1  ORF type:complete len:240 (+),score=65.00 TRINITY_DN3030_c0_g1_i1:233-952(+)